MEDEMLESMKKAREHQREIESLRIDIRVLRSRMKCQRADIELMGQIIIALLVTLVVTLLILGVSL